MLWLGIAFGVWLLLILILFLAGRRAAARFAARVIPDSLALLRGLLRDPRIGAGSKALLALAFVWIASPIDLVPEFIPVLGPLDDLVVALLVLRFVIRKAGTGIVREHWNGDEDTLRRLLRACGAAEM